MSGGLSTQFELPPVDSTLAVYAESVRRSMIPQQFRPIDQSQFGTDRHQCWSGRGGASRFRLGQRSRTAEKMVGGRISDQ